MLRVIVDALEANTWVAMQIAAGKKRIPKPKPTPRPWENDGKKKQKSIDRQIDALMKLQAEENATNG